jgi:hypothetical protein
MTPVKQTILHEPDNGLYGNCAQAAIASLLSMPINEVPHFADGLLETDEDGIVYNERLQGWLMSKGYGLLTLTIVPEYLENWQESAKTICDHHLIAGRTIRGTLHVVVGKNGEVVHDPHPSDDGLLPPTEEDPWYFEFIVKRL